MGNKRLSVIVPVYNLEQYVKQCVESVLPIPEEAEIILVDDGSADQSPALCDELANRYEGVRVVHQENSGAAVARNTGMRAATGEYLMFIDGDDFLQPGAIEQVLRSLDGETDIFCYNYYFQYFGEEKIVSSRHLNEILLFDAKGGISALTFLDVSPLPMPWLYVIKREYIVSKEIYMTPGLLDEDEEWTARLFAWQPAVKVVQEGYYMYRQNRENSLTFARALKNSLADVKIIELLLAEKKNHPYSPCGEMILDNKCRQMVNMVLDDIPNLSKEDAVKAKSALKPYKRLLRTGNNADRIHYYLDGLLGRERVKKAVARLIAFKNGKSRKRAV